ncbi:MAG TPA: endolytic transglycosylase MltG [Syntrophales bacterium]|nr:endolytic transglycosylase MltG [Syntrophales bacterium]
MKKIKIIHKYRRSFTVFTVALLLSFFLATVHYAISPVDNRNEIVTVDIPKGTSFLQSVDNLERVGLVKYKYLFYLLVVSRNAQGHIRAGEYELTTSMSPMEIISKLVKGDIKSYLVTIPEDITFREIASRLAAFKLVDEKAFLSICSDAKFLASLGIEGASAEGYLYPDTYRLDRSMSAKDIMKIMVNQFWKMFTPEMQKRAEELRMTIPQVITLASIIGKESGNKDEKPLISAVFCNRLKKGMKLQSDPTAVYNLNDFSGNIKRKHLMRDAPYNTYRINGLPPGPIANPAVDSLNAALYPAPVNYLYFVSNNDGSHQFSSSLSAHNRAVLNYQIKRKKE